MAKAMYAKVAGKWSKVYPSAPPVPAYNEAEGGVINHYWEGEAFIRSHTFDSSSTLTVTKNERPFRRFILAGGGGGGFDWPQIHRGGGGGAGGLIEDEATLPLGAVPIVVGNGGPAGGGQGSSGGNGQDSSLNGVVAKGGGSGGGSSSSVGAVPGGGGNGGSGGGSGGTDGTKLPGGKGTPGQGYDGTYIYGGGAGGPATASAGGPGKVSSIVAGTPVTYARGGTLTGQHGASGPGDGGDGGGTDGAPGPYAGGKGRVVVAYEVEAVTSGSVFDATRFGAAKPANWAGEFDASDGGVDYHYHIFTGSGQFAVGEAITVDVLVVGGGQNGTGGPGYSNGGGNGGAVVIQSGIALTRGAVVPVAVGAGGRQAAGGDHAREAGQPSSFGTFVTAAGGTGAAASGPGAPTTGTHSTFTGTDVEYGAGGPNMTNAVTWRIVQPGCGGLYDGAQWNSYGKDGIVIVRYRKSP
jgi:hypothetical protein